MSTEIMLVIYCKTSMGEILFFLVEGFKRLCAKIKIKSINLSQIK